MNRHESHQSKVVAIGDQMEAALLASIQGGKLDRKSIIDNPILQQTYLQLITHRIDQMIERGHIVEGDDGMLQHTALGVKRASLSMATEVTTHIIFPQTDVQYR